MRAVSWIGGGKCGASEGDGEEEGPLRGGAEGGARGSHGGGGAFKGRGPRAGPACDLTEEAGPFGGSSRGRGPQKGGGEARNLGGSRARWARGGSQETAKTLGVQGPRQPGYLVQACRPPVLCHLPPHTLSPPLLPG